MTQSLVDTHIEYRDGIDAETDTPLVTYITVGFHLRTSDSRPNNSLPLSVKSTGRTAISQPFSFRPTFMSNARPRIWCPKQTPTMRTRLCARTSFVNSTSLRIQGASSNAFHPIGQQDLASHDYHDTLMQTHGYLSVV